MMWNSYFIFTLSELKNQFIDVKQDIKHLTAALNNNHQQFKDLTNHIINLQDNNNSPLYSFEDFTIDSGYQFPLGDDGDFTCFNTQIATNSRNLKENLVMKEKVNI